VLLILLQSKYFFDLFHVSYRLLPSFRFGLQCIFGGAGCKASAALLGWSNYFSNIVGCFSFACLMRFSEGANFTIIALVSPF
jgi:hypothetical protein